MSTVLARVLKVAITGEDQLTKEMDKAAQGIEKFGSRTEKVSSVFGRNLGRMASFASELGVPIDMLGGAFDTMAGHLESSSKRSANAVQRLQNLSKGITLSVGGAAIAVGAASLKMADAYERPNASLEASVKAAGINWETYKETLGSVEDKYAKFGYTSADVDAALSSAMVSTQSAKGANESLGLAADLAAMKHISLADATNITNKALTGNLKPLKQLGIDLPIASSSALKLQTAQQKVTTATSAASAILAANGGHIDKNSKDWGKYQNALGNVHSATKKLSDLQQSHGQIVGALSQRLRGQASTAAETYSGKMHAMRAEVGNLEVKIGQKLVPVLEHLVNAVSKSVTWLEKHKGVAIALAGVIGSVLGAAIAVFVGQKVVKFVDGTKKMVTGLGDMAKSIWQTAAKWIGGNTAMAASTETTAAETELSYTAMSTSAEEAAVATDAAIGSTGIGLILIGLGIGITYLATHWHQVWGGIKRVAVGAWHLLDHAIHSGIAKVILTPIAPLLMLATHWKTVFNGIKTVAVDAWHFIDGNLIQPLSDFFGGTFKSLCDGISSAWDGLWNGLSKVVQGAWDGLKPIINVFIAGINAVIKGYDHSLGLISGLPQVHTIPELRYKGGDVMAGRPYIVGEIGAELFVPRTSGQIIPLYGPNGSTPGHGTPGGRGSSGGTTQSHHSSSKKVHINVTSMADPTTIAREVMWALDFAPAS